MKGEFADVGPAKRGPCAPLTKPPPGNPARFVQRRLSTKVGLFNFRLSSLRAQCNIGVALCGTEDPCVRSAASRL